MGIQSNRASAQLHATAIQSGANSITAIGEFSKDNSTTLEGNASAHLAITSESSRCGQVSLKIGEFVSLIHSTAAEFEAVDQNISASIAQNSLGTYPKTPNQSPTYNAGLFDQGGAY